MLWGCVDYVFAREAGDISERQGANRFRQLKMMLRADASESIIGFR